MGAIGRWIDERCKAEPDVMRRVLGRKFGNLARFLDGDRCGCLVGSWALESGRARRWGVTASPHELSAEATVGYLVWDLTCWGAPTRLVQEDKRTQADVIRLLKQRIRKALGLAPTRRETEVVCAVPAPQEPQ